VWSLDQSGIAMRKEEQGGVDVRDEDCEGGRRFCVLFQKKRENYTVGITILHSLCKHSQ